MEDEIHLPSHIKKKGVDASDDKDPSLNQIILFLILPNRYTYIWAHGRKKVLSFKRVYKAIFNTQFFYFIMQSFKDGLVSSFKKNKMHFLIYSLFLSFALFGLAWNINKIVSTDTQGICTDKQNKIIKGGYYPYLCGIERNPMKHYLYIKSRNYDNNDNLFYEEFIKGVLPIFDITESNTNGLKKELKFPLKRITEDEHKRGFFEMSVLDYNDNRMSGLNQEFNLKNVSFDYLETYVEFLFKHLEKGKDICISSIELGINRNIIFMNKMNLEKSSREYGIKKYKNIACYDPVIITDQSLMGTFRAQYLYNTEEKKENETYFIERPRSTTIECKNNRGEIRQYTLFDLNNIACFYQAYELNYLLFYSKNDLVVV